MEAKECDPVTGQNCGPIAHAGMHGPDPLVEGKQMAFEAQIREHAKEMGDRAAASHKERGTGTGGVMDRAYQGLQALSRKLLGEKAGTNNNPAEVQPSVGEVGYCDPSSALEGDMKSAMEAAAGGKKGMHTPHALVLERDWPHIHAPEGYHPEAVVSMAEVCQQQQQQQQRSEEGNVDAKNNSYNNVEPADAREGVGLVGPPAPPEPGKPLTARDYLYYWSG